MPKRIFTLVTRNYCRAAIHISKSNKTDIQGDFYLGGQRCVPRGRHGVCVRAWTPCRPNLVPELGQNLYMVMDVTNGYLFGSDMLYDRAEQYMTMLKSDGRLGRIFRETVRQYLFDHTLTTELWEPLPQFPLTPRRRR